MNHYAIEISYLWLKILLVLEFPVVVDIVGGFIYLLFDFILLQLVPYNKIHEVCERFKPDMLCNTIYCVPLVIFSTAQMDKSF